MSPAEALSPLQGCCRRDPPPAEFLPPPQGFVAGRNQGEQRGSEIESVREMRSGRGMMRKRYQPPPFLYFPLSPCPPCRCCCPPLPLLNLRASTPSSPRPIVGLPSARSITREREKVDEGLNREVFSPHVRERGGRVRGWALGLSFSK